jgi:hypothetical protein
MINLPLVGVRSDVGRNTWSDGDNAFRSAGLFAQPQS